MKKKLLLLLLLGMTQLVRAQTKSISGKVTSPENEGIPGVNVLLKGTNVGTATKADGTYQISVPDKVGTLVFSFIGYKTVDVEIGNKTTVTSN